MNNPIVASILLVEDDMRLAQLVSRYLENHGLGVRIIARGDQVVTQVQLEPPDLIILDLGLPGQDGLSVCKALRTMHSVPILILTADNSDPDQVLGLELGADDYVVKPVEPAVLLARIHALLRRSTSRAGSGQKALQFGRLSINPQARSVTLDGVDAGLTSNEFELLAYLVANAGVVRSREQIFQHLYRREYDGLERVLDVRISHLRKKLGCDTESAEQIKTVRGHGYLFNPRAW
jgi:DNA-binding response OmpR family regulator